MMQPLSPTVQGPRSLLEQATCLCWLPPASVTPLFMVFLHDAGPADLVCQLPGRLPVCPTSTCLSFYLGVSAVLCHAWHAVPGNYHLSYLEPVDDLIYQECDPQT